MKSREKRKRSKDDVIDDGVIDITDSNLNYKDWKKQKKEKKEKEKEGNGDKTAKEKEIDKKKKKKEEKKAKASISDKEVEVERGTKSVQSFLEKVIPKFTKESCVLDKEKETKANVHAPKNSAISSKLSSEVICDKLSTQVPVNADSANVDADEERSIGKAEADALSYLETWHKDRESFKFQKVRQSFLLRHLYNPIRINKRNFKILLLYMKGLQGPVRDRTLTEARDVVRRTDNKETGAERSDSVRYLRARDVLKCLDL